MDTLFKDCTEGLPVDSNEEQDRQFKERTRRQVPHRRRNNPLRKKHKPNPREGPDIQVPDKGIKSLSELVLANPSMCIETKHVQATTAPTASAGSRDHPTKPVTLSQLIAAHTKLNGQIHIAQQLFDQKPLEIKDAVVALESGTAALPLLHSGLVEWLLGEAGSFHVFNGLQGAVRKFPACQNGDECQFKKDWPGAKAPGRSWMTAEEFECFMGKNEPPPQRICVVCHWFVAENLVCEINSAEGEVKLDRNDMLLQHFTNMMECPGGYRKEYMQLQPPDDGKYRGVFGTLVAYQKKHLVEYRDPLQVVFDEKNPPGEDLVATSPIVLTASPRGAVDGFSERSGFSSSTPTTSIAHLFNMRFHVLKQYNKKPLRPNEDATNPFLEKTPVSTTTTVNDYWSGLLVDSRFKKLKDVVCETTLPLLHSVISERLFKRSLGSNRNKLRHLMFKAWPVRCWSRKFWTVLKRTFEEDRNQETQQQQQQQADPSSKKKKQKKKKKKKEIADDGCDGLKVEAVLNRMLLCSLLGNYPHIPASASRPAKNLRLKLYESLDAVGHATAYKSAESVAWRAELLERCPRVYMHALQEFMCADIRDSPALLPHVRNRMPKFDGLFDIVCRVNNHTRQLVIAGNGKADYDALSEELETVREQLLEISYDHLHPPFLDFLREVRSAAKPSADRWFRMLSDQKKMMLVEFQTQRPVKPSSEISKRIKTALSESKNEDSENSEEEESDNEDEKAGDRKLSKSERNPTSQAVLIEQAVRQGFERSAKREAGVAAVPDGIQALAITSMKIPVEQSKVLESFIATFDPRSTSADDVFWTVLRVYDEVGAIDHIAATEAQRHWFDYALVKTAKEQWKSRMLLFSQRHPYEYALLQASRRFFARHRQHQTYPLPANITQAQIQALERTWGCPPFKEATVLRVCPCCREIRTVVRSQHTPHLNSVVGVRGTITNIATGKLYCDRAVVFGHRQCGAADQELLELPMLGRWIGWKGRGIVLCCHCGHPMRPERQADVFTGDGKYLACVKCSAALRAGHKDDFFKAYPVLQRPEDFKCFLCDKALASEKKRRPFSFLAKDAFICSSRKHSQAYLDKFFTQLEFAIKEYEEQRKVAAEMKEEKFLKEFPVANLLDKIFTDDVARDKLLKLALKVRAAIKDATEKSNRKRNDYQLKLTKQANARNQKR